MNIVIIQELCRKWRNQVDASMRMDTANDENNIGKKIGREKALTECADDLQKLIDIFYPGAE